MFFILSESADKGETWSDQMYGDHFKSGQEAQAEARRRNETYKNTRWRYRVRKVVDTDEDNFIAREQAKGHKFITKDDLPDFVYWPSWRLAHIDPDNKRHIRFFRNITDAAECVYTSVKMSRFFLLLIVTLRVETLKKNCLS